MHSSNFNGLLYNNGTKARHYVFTKLPTGQIQVSSEQLVRESFFEHAQFLHPEGKVEIVPKANMSKLKLLQAAANYGHLR